MTEIPVPPEAVTAALDDLTAWAVSYDWLTGLRPDQVRSVCSGMVDRVLEIAAPAIRAAERERLAAPPGKFGGLELLAEAARIAAAAERKRILALLDAWKCSCGEESCTALDGVRDFADQLAADDSGAPSPATADAGEPPCEGFRWIGQPFTSCDRCGRPAWEHAGMEVLADGATRPWRPGYVYALRRKWGGQDG